MQLRARGGILVGSVKDKMNGRLVEAAWVEYIVIDNGGGGTTRTDGEFQLTVPTDCDLLILVHAKGYKGWLYNDGSNPTRPIVRVASGRKESTGRGTGTIIEDVSSTLTCIGFRVVCHNIAISLIL